MDASRKEKSAAFITLYHVDRSLPQGAKMSLTGAIEALSRKIQEMDNLDPVSPAERILNGEHPESVFIEKIGKTPLEYLLEESGY